MKRTYMLIMILILLSSVISVTFINVSSDIIAVSGDVKSEDLPTIIIDAGHGGEDGGAVSVTGDLEKDLNLDICFTLEKLLIQGGYNTVMIRDADTSIHDDDASTTRERKVSDIHNRVEVANSKSNNILVSIHQNYFTESQYFGAQIFYSKNNPSSINLADSIRNAIVGLLQNNNTRQCKCSNDIYLLDNSNVPSIIVECGFLSNPDEAYLLSTEEYRDNMAYCIYLGIIEYIYTS